MARTKHAAGATAGPQTYQDVLDEAIEETFPASDPIAPAVERAGHTRVSTRKNAADWKLDRKASRRAGASPRAATPNAR